MDDQEAAQMYQLNLVGTGENGDNIYNLGVVENQLLQGENKMMGEDMDKSVNYSCQSAKKCVTLKGACPSTLTSIMLQTKLKPMMVMLLLRKVTCLKGRGEVGGHSAPLYLCIQ